MTKVIKFLIQQGAKVKTLEGICIEDIKDVIKENHTFSELDAEEIEKLARENNRDALKIIFTKTPDLLCTEDVIDIIHRYSCFELLLSGSQTHPKNLFDL